MSDARLDLAVPTLELAVERFELACGATLLVSPRPGAPIVAAQADLRGGPSLDPEGLEGTAWLAGSLADQGTERRSEEELAALLEPAGGELSGDALGVAGSIVRDQWELLLEVLAEVLRSPRYPKAEVERQKRRLIDRLTVEREDPRAQGAQLFRRLVYGDHWLGRPAYGHLESVERIEPRHLRAHHRTHWVAARCTIAVCGDVRPADVRKRLDALLRGWKRGEKLPPRETKLPARGKRTAAFRATREQVHVYLGHLGVRRKDPDYPALVVMDHVLGTGPGFTNRISRILRDELGLAYTVHASIHSSAGLLPGMFTAYIGTSPANVATAVEGFLREMRRIRDEDVGEEELRMAKSYLLGSFALGFERSTRRAAYMISAQVHGLPPDHLTRLVEAFSEVSAADVRRAANAHLFPDRCCLAAAGPIKKAELAKLH